MERDLTLELDINFRLLISTFSPQKNYLNLGGLINQLPPHLSLKTITWWLSQTMLFILFMLLNTASAKIYMSPESFLTLVKNRNSTVNKFQSKTLWLNKNIQSQIKAVLGHKYPKIRLRYKMSKNANEGIQPYPNSISVWHLEEIGKERPISFGVAIKNDQIQIIRVLEFRESRGYEINTARFVKQFEQIGIDGTGKLDRTIDGITGATLSVRAMKKITRVALMLHRQVMKSKKNNPKS